VTRMLHTYFTNNFQIYIEHTVHGKCMEHTVYEIYMEHI